MVKSATAEDDHQDASAEDEAVDQRLDREVDLAERRHLAQPREDGQPVAHDERVDDRDHQRQRQRVARAARHLAPHAGGGRGARSGGGDGAEHERMLERERAGGQRQAVGAAGRARAACSGLARRR